MNKSKTPEGKHAYLLSINKKAVQQGKLLSATIELLDQCNFRCKYCYVRGIIGSIMSLDNAKRVLNELRQEGCIWLTITGGEPLLHPNFLEIYRYAFDLGFGISVLTNGYLIDDQHIQLFKEKKPKVIDITLYGIDESTYSAFVGRNGCFEQFQSNLTRLLDNGIPFQLKATLTNHTYEMLTEYRAYASKLGVPFRYDTMVVPQLNDKSSLELRLSPELAVSLLSEDSLKRIKRTYIEGMNQTDENRLYKCNGGFNYLFITCDMKLIICPFARKYQYDLLNKDATVHDGHLWLMQQQTRKLSLSDKCFNCNLKNICKYCPARFEIESGSEYSPPEWYCEYGKCVENRLREVYERECSQSD